LSHPQNEAEQLLEDFGFNELPIEPRAICSAISDPSYEVIYHEQPLDSESILGFSVQNGIFVNSNIKSIGRKNFTAAHELGHLVLHIQRNIKETFQCHEQDIFNPLKNTNQIELEADLFAASLLMPRKLILPLIVRHDLDWGMILDISNKCKTSLLATAKRVVSLANEPIALVIHKEQKLWIFETSRSFPYYIGRPFLRRDIKFQKIIYGEVFVDDWNVSDAIDWVDDSKISHKAKINYSTLFNEKYRWFMTLLSPENSDEYDDVEEWEPPRF
jgi:hypothetical protein